MNFVTPFAAASVLLASTAAPDRPAPAPGPACLNVRNIERTEVPDDRTLIFHMRDGKVWVNRLKQACPSLRISPFTQVLQAGTLLCANQQSIEVQLTGITCVLGEFMPLPAEP